VPGSRPLRLRIHATSTGALFVDSGAPAFPYTGRSLDERTGDYLEKVVRIHPHVAAAEIEVALPAAPGGSEETDAARRDLASYFRTKRRLAELSLRVNQREGWGFLRRSFPLLIAALAVAGVLLVFGPDIPAGAIGDLVTTLFYLVFITIVWVLLWDPIEKLLFDAYLLRARVAAFDKLSRAEVRFIVAPATDDDPA
jgi:hypothetical protein